MPGVYGFRPGCSARDMLLAIEKTAIEQDPLGVCGRRRAERLPQRPHR